MYMFREKIVTMIAVMLLFTSVYQVGVIDAKPAPASKGQQSQKAKKTLTLSDLDAKTRETAKKAMILLAGEHVEWERVEDNGDSWTIFSKDDDRGGSIRIDKKTKKVRIASVYLYLDELSPSIQEQSLLAVQDIDPSRNLESAHVYRFIYNFTGNSAVGEVQTFIKSQNVQVSLNGDLITQVILSYRLDELNPDMIKIAENAVSIVNDRKMEFIGALRITRKGFDVLEFIIAPIHADMRVSIEPGTGELVEVRNINTRIDGVPHTAKGNKKFLKLVTAKEARNSIIREIRKWYNIDLQTYHMVRDKNPRRFIFSKKGERTVEVEINAKKQIVTIRKL